MNYEELKKGYEKDITNTENQIAANANELQQKKNESTANYNEQLSNYDNLIKQQNELVDAATKKATDTANAQFEYNSNIINQNKEQAAKDTDSNIKGAYVDYMRETNRYGANRENLASNGMTAQGYAESLMASMYNTYQTRVSTAKDSLMKANQEYDNQMQQALMNRDTALAEAAYNDLQQKTQIALSGFEYKNALYNQYTNYMNDLDNTYFSRNQALQSNITNYRSAITGINQVISAEKEANRQYQLAQQKLAEDQRQYDLSLAEQKRQFNASLAQQKKESELNFKDNNNEEEELSGLDSLLSKAKDTNINRREWEELDERSRYLAGRYMFKTKYNEKQLIKRIKQLYDEHKIDDEDVSRILYMYKY